jgi:hypothetical protein
MTSEQTAPRGVRARGIGVAAARPRRSKTVRRSFMAEYRALALEPTVDAAKLEQIIAAEERRQAREAGQAFAQDMAAMAGELPVIAENGAIRLGEETVATYALWEDLNDAIRPILHRWGFALSFEVSSSLEEIRVGARLMHRSGHVETTSLSVPPDPGTDRNRIQAIGSALSYAKRYTACALLNLTSRGEDDDGAATSVLISHDQLIELECELLRTRANKLRLLDYLGVSSLSALPTDRFSEAMGAVKARAEEIAA